MSALLTACPSTPHRAVLGLLSVALGGAGYHGLERDLDSTPSEMLIQIATFSYLHTVLATAFQEKPSLAAHLDEDARVYLAEMTRENTVRNDAILRQIRQIGCAFEAAGIDGTLLKGAADLALKIDPLEGRRFLSDIDILVAPEITPQVKAVLESLGAVQEQKSDDHLFGQHHLAPFWSDAWLVPVEVHTQTGGSLASVALPAKSILSDARFFEPGLSLPSVSHRLSHMVLHAQLSDRRWERAVLSPRDVYHAAMFAAITSAEDRETSRACLAAADLDDMNHCFWDAATTLIEGSAPKTDWSRRAARHFGRPTLRRRTALADRISQMTATFFTTHDGRRRYLRAAFSRRAWANLARSLADLSHRTR